MLTMTGGERAPIFIAGKPLTDIWAAPGLKWQATVRAAISEPLIHPRLRFIRNDRAQFDLDNLAFPVLAASECSACDSVWATVEAGELEGVWVSEERPPPAPAASASVYIARPSVASISGRAAVPELVGKSVVAEGCPLGLALMFDAAETQVGEMSYDGPTKSLVDDLGPLLGFRMYRGRQVSADNRIKDLRISRGHHPGTSGVTVSVWPLSG